jgi:hypothetical protein
VTGVSGITTTTATTTERRSGQAGPSGWRRCAGPPRGAVRPGGRSAFSLHARYAPFPWACRDFLRKSLVQAKGGGRLVGECVYVHPAQCNPLTTSPSRISGKTLRCAGPKGAIQNCPPCNRTPGKESGVSALVQPISAGPARGWVGGKRFVATTVIRCSTVCVTLQRNQSSRSPLPGPPAPAFPESFALSKPWRAGGVNPG